MRYLVAYVSAAVVFLGLDFAWLGFLARNAYRSWIGGLMRDELNVSAAVLFYLVYVVGLVIFAIAPALKAGSWQTAALYGALFGFFAYGIYELTNYATLKDWPFAMVVVDMAWGTALSAFAAIAGYAITRHLV
jgi:uncharacterized membrane protein